jgi:hypothetical protein
MENSSITIGIIITLVILIPTFYLATAGKRKLKKNLDKFINSLKDNSIFVTEHSQISQYIIGIDKGSGIIVYKKGENGPEIINIRDVKNCSNNIPKNRHNINSNLYIELIMSNSQNITFELYDATFALSPSKEIKIIDEWTNKINELLSSKR